MRLLIDECLSPALVRLAQESGYEAYHIAYIGKAGFEDRNIVELALVRDMVLVTNNAGDFRRLYCAQELHPGLIIIVPNVDLQTQLRLFGTTLSHLRAIGELVNKALEVRLRDDDVSFDEYEWPRGS